MSAGSGSRDSFANPMRKVGLWREVLARATPIGGVAPARTMESEPARRIRDALAAATRRTRTNRDSLRVRSSPSLTIRSDRDPADTSGDESHGGHAFGRRGSRLRPPPLPPAGREPAVVGPPRPGGDV